MSLQDTVGNGHDNWKILLIGTQMSGFCLTKNMLRISFTYM